MLLILSTRGQLPAVVGGDAAAHAGAAGGGAAASTQAPAPPPLTPYPTTLFVVPNFIIKHIAGQIQLHVLPAVGLKVGKHVESTAARMVLSGAFTDIDRPCPSTWTYQVKVWPEMREEGFNNDLPAAEELGSCNIFLVSRERLAREMQRGKPRGRDAIRGDRRVKSELLKMRFLRLIVDEGHRLGANSKTDDRELLSLISAEVCSYQVRSCDAVALS